ncbi:hypothetical protein AWB74_08750 [Caballeronia arvi]|uniref:Uncharacterized protein n=1 Tax=Caballeronia arvi TaxID=1777135 RepID=A0A158L740_9BURK|nr:hypothetical protein AWB74_08750 [Caballeronia arvi]
MPNARNNDRLTHGRMTGDLRLHFPKLDTEAANLDLMIVPAKKFDIAVGTITCDIAGAVHTRIGDERIIDKSLGCQLRPIEITTRHTRATDIKLANCTDRHQLKLCIEQIDARIGNRLADDGQRLFDRNLGDGRIHGALGWTIDVEGADLFSLCEAIPRLLRHRFATNEQRQPGAPAFEQASGEQHIELSRGAVEHVDAARVQIFDQRRAIGTHVCGNDDQPMTRKQGRQALQRRIERDAGVQADAGLWGAICEHRRLQCMMQVQHMVMLHHHALRLASRTGRVDHVSEVMRCDGRLRIVLREFFVERCMGIEHAQRSCVAQCFTTGGIGDQKQRRGIGEDVAQTFARISWIQWHVGAARLEYRHQRDDHVDAAFHAQRYAIFRTHAQCDQMMRKSIGACVELRVGE